MVTFAVYKKWKPIKETFDFRFDLDDTTYLLLQQSDALYELELVLIQCKNEKMSRVRIGQGLTSFMISSANEYALRILEEQRKYK